MLEAVALGLLIGGHDWAALRDDDAAGLAGPEPVRHPADLLIRPDRDAPQGPVDARADGAAVGPERPMDADGPAAEPLPALDGRGVPDGDEEVE